MKKMTRAAATVAIMFAATTMFACPGPKVPGLEPGPTTPGACSGLSPEGCQRVQGLLSAAQAFSNTKRELLLDPSSNLEPGRGVSKEGRYRVLPKACAKPRKAEARTPELDAGTVDFSYIGLAVDDTMVGLDEELTPYFSGGIEASKKKLRVVAMAFVRDKDPQFFEASDDVSFERESCACGPATHFVGSVKYGGMLSFDLDVTAAEVHGRAVSVFKAKIGERETRTTQAQVGGLEIEGLDAYLAGKGERPLSFRVKNPVPVAYALYPIADVCRFSFPVPDVSPTVLDFGDVPYGAEAQRLLHVVNRAPFDLYAHFAGGSYAVPALGSLDVPVAFRPQGERLGCESQSRQEPIVFSPRDAQAPVVPREHSVPVLERVRTGRATHEQRERVDSGEARKPNYASTVREWNCPAEYAVEDCRVDAPACAQASCSGYQFPVERTANGCRFRCQGPESVLFGGNACRFEAVMKCRLRCPQ